MIAWFLSTATGRNIATIGALLIAGLAIAGALLSRGAANERSRTRERTLQAERATHDRINRAPTLRDAGDPERIDWLRDYAARNRN